MFRSTGFRLAALYTAIFAASGIVLVIAILITTRGSLSRDFDGRVTAELNALTQEFDTEGLEGVSQAVTERDHIPGAMAYGLQGADGQPIAGRLSAAPRPLGWSDDDLKAGGQSLSVRMRAVDLPSGERLIVGDNEERIEQLDGVIIKSVGWVALAAVLVGAIGGLILGRDLHSRLSSVAATAEAIAEGDLSRRAPLRGDGDDLDDMALAFNLMLDRIGELLDSLRQVTTDVAHDLRTPLTRLRQKLELLQRATGDPRRLSDLAESALGDLDSILATFTALLRIAQIEGGDLRSSFVTVDLAAVAADVVETFAPAAEDTGHRLALDGLAPAPVAGDRELLTQMLINLVENALRHTPPGTHITVAAGGGDPAWLAVRDNGPGIPETERPKVFDRFYRLERSRTTAGSGLGLSLAAAVARLHGGECRLADLNPGLEAKIVLPGKTA